MNLILLYVFLGCFSSEFHHNFPQGGLNFITRWLGKDNSLSKAVYLTEHRIKLLVILSMFHVILPACAHGCQARWQGRIEAKKCNRHRSPHLSPTRPPLRRSGHLPPHPKD